MVERTEASGRVTTPDFEEYTYQKEHLEEHAALKQYQEKICIRTDAIIQLDMLDCGHWAVREYRTELEKARFYRNKLAKHLHNAFSLFLK